MFRVIDDFLTAAEVQNVRDLARQAKFIDGRATNPHNTVKANLMADPNDPAANQASQIALAAFQRNAPAREFAFPKKVITPKLCRYATSMHYGAHADAAFLPMNPEPLRSDLSCTIFISDPASYQGGELTIYLGTVDVQIKEKAGAAVLYPSTTLHQVMPVTAGERLVMLSFIESQVPDQMCQRRRQNASVRRSNDPSVMLAGRPPVGGLPAFRDQVWLASSGMLRERRLLCLSL